MHIMTHIRKQAFQGYKTRSECEVGGAYHGVWLKPEKKSPITDILLLYVQSE